MPKKQTEMLHRGERIVQVDYANLQPFNKADAFGFEIAHAFKVLDEFDEPALPLLQTWFWSPGEAIAAIELRDVILPMVKGKKWPTTVQYEYGAMLAYRRNFYLVYEALKKIREACEQAKDFDDNPRKEVEDILNQLHQNVAAQPCGLG